MPLRGKVLNSRLSAVYLIGVRMANSKAVAHTPQPHIGEAYVGIKCYISTMYRGAVPNTERPIANDLEKVCQKLKIYFFGLRWGHPGMPRQADHEASLVATGSTSNWLIITFLHPVLLLNLLSCGFFARCVSNDRLLTHILVDLTIVFLHWSAFFIKIWRFVGKMLVDSKKVSTFAS